MAAVLCMEEGGSDLYGSSHSDVYEGRHLLRLALAVPPSVPLLPVAAPPPAPSSVWSIPRHSIVREQPQWCVRERRTKDANGALALRPSTRLCGNEGRRTKDADALAQQCGNEERRTKDAEMAPSHY